MRDHGYDSLVDEVIVGITLNGEKSLTLHQEQFRQPKHPIHSQNSASNDNLPLPSICFMSLACALYDHKIPHQATIYPFQVFVLCLLHVLCLVLFIYGLILHFCIISRQISNLVNFSLKIKNIQTSSRVKVHVDLTLGLTILNTT